MSELSALRVLGDAEKAAVPESRAFLESVRPKPNMVATASGKMVDISRGFNVKGVDGLTIPFKADTPLEKAKEWTTNFYSKNFEVIKGAKPGEIKNHPRLVEGPDEFNLIRDKNDPQTYLQFADLGDAYHVQMSFTPQSKRGAGVGAGMYRQLFEQAQKDGKIVKSDTAMSDASVAIWQRFKQLGYPITEHPRRQMTNGGFENAKDANAPLFEFDPSKIQKDTKLPGFTRAPTVDPQVAQFHQELKTEISKIPRGDESKDARQELNKRVLAYQEDPTSVDKEQLMNDIKAAQKPAPTKLEPGGPGNGNGVSQNPNL